MADATERSNAQDTPELKCNARGKPEPKDNSLKQCAKCRAEHYCSRECQKADWKKHNKVCAQLAAESAKQGEQISENSYTRDTWVNVV